MLGKGNQVLAAEKLRPHWGLPLPDPLCGTGRGVVKAGGCVFGSFRECSGGCRRCREWNCLGARALPAPALCFSVAAASHSGRGIAKLPPACSNRAHNRDCGMLPADVSQILTLSLWLPCGQLGRQGQGPTVVLLEAPGSGIPGEYFASKGFSPFPFLWARQALQPLSPPFSLAVDNILIPENRAHLSTEVQLKELLEKLDLVSAMRSSGARTRRVRMLRREINALRQKLAQPPPPQPPSLSKTVSHGELLAGPRGSVAVLQQALREEPEDDGDRGERQSRTGRVLGAGKGARVKLKS